MSATYRGKPIKEMSREELEESVIFLSELNRKLVERSEPQPPEKHQWQDYLAERTKGDEMKLLPSSKSPRISEVEPVLPTGQLKPTNCAPDVWKASAGGVLKPDTDDR